MNLSKRKGLSHNRQNLIDRRIILSLFVVALVAEVIGAYIIIYQNGHAMPDAVSRTANAYYVLNIIPHKLASIGFVWNPLPSLLQLIILPFDNLWPPLATDAMAGSILTAIFAASNAALIYHYLRAFKTDRLVSIIIVVLYTANPFIFYYGCNGMSEIIFFTFIILSTGSLSLWIVDRKSSRFVTIGVALAFAFLTRYETFALCVSFFIALVIIVYTMKDEYSPFKHKSARMKLDYTVASSTVIFLPVAYTVLIWIFLNWTIMSDPFFFLTSAYSNDAQSDAAVWAQFEDGIRSPLNAIKFALIRMLPFSPLFIIITIERIITKRLFKWDYLILLILIFGISIFHIVMLMNGKSFGWLRFFSFALPFCVAWIPYEIYKLKGDAKIITTGFLCVALAISGAIMPSYFKDYSLAREEYMAFYQPEDQQLIAQKELSQIVNSKYKNDIILMDSFIGAKFIMNLDRPENLITTTSDEFEYAVKNPKKYKVDYLIVPQSMYTGQLDAINKEYPNLFSDGGSWLELVYDNEMYRIYKVAGVALPSERAGDTK